jgi:Family of unknown function (DUF6502)/IclR helix-turn-helix domain
MRASRADRELAAATDAALLELAKLLVGAGVGFGTFAQAARSAFVRAVQSDLLAAGARVSVSAIAAATGLPRPEVARLLRSPTAPQPASDIDAARVLRGMSKVDRVVHMWRTTRPWRGRALALSRVSGTDGKASPSFGSLVAKFGGDIPPRAMQRELLRAGLARLASSGEIVLVTHASERSANAARALRTSLPWLQSAQHKPVHSMVRWAEASYRDERSLLDALDRLTRDSQKLLGSLDARTRHAGKSRKTGRATRRGRANAAGHITLGLTLAAHRADD